MQIPLTKLTLLNAVKSGVVGRETITYVPAREITGSLSVMDKEDVIKRYSESNYKDNGNYSFQTIETLSIGNMLMSGSKRLKVIGFRQGRLRNTAYLVEVV